jgi:hypothetical protein
MTKTVGLAFWIVLALTLAAQSAQPFWLVLRVGVPVYVGDGNDDAHAAVCRSIQAYDDWAEGGPLTACRRVPMGTAAHVLDISINQGLSRGTGLTQRIVLIRADNETWRGYTAALSIMPRVPVGAVLTVFNINPNSHGETVLTLNGQLDATPTSKHGQTLRDGTKVMVERFDPTTPNDNVFVRVLSGPQTGQKGWMLYDNYGFSWQ